MAPTALRALQKALPNLGEFNRVAVDLVNRTDREVAIVGASLIETAMEFAIRDAYKDMSHDDAKDLLGNAPGSGVLASLAAKVLFSRVTGIISDAMQSDLRKINSIRNTFAHNLIDLTFDQPDIAKQCNGFLVHQLIEEERRRLRASAPNLSPIEHSESLWYEGQDISKDHLVLTDAELRVVVCTPFAPRKVDKPRQRFIEAVQVNWYFLMCRGAFALDLEITKRKTGSSKG
jgi:hypothetical protein